MIQATGQGIAHSLYSGQITFLLYPRCHRRYVPRPNLRTRETLGHSRIKPRSCTMECAILATSIVKVERKAKTEYNEFNQR